MLDMTNEPEELVQLSMKRLVAELKVMEYDEADIKRALHKVKEVAWVNCREVIKFAEKDVESLKDFAAAYDLFREWERGADARLLERELNTGSAQGC